MSSVHRTYSGAGAGRLCGPFYISFMASVLSSLVSFGQICSFDLRTMDLDVESRQNDLNYRSVTNSSWDLGEFQAFLENRDPLGSGSSINHTVGTDLLGGEHNPYIMSLSSDKRRSIDVLLKFTEPVDHVAFVLLDIDRDVNWDWQDSVEIHAYSKGTYVDPLDFTFSYDRNNVFRTPGTTSFKGLRNQVDNIAILGNLEVAVSGNIDSIKIKYAYTTDPRIRNGAQQHVGLTGLNVGSADLCRTPILKSDMVCSETGEISKIEVLDNDFISAPDTSSLRIVTSPKNGTAWLDSNGAIAYTPGSSFFVLDSLSYEICNTNGICGDAATVFIQHNPINSFYVKDDINLTRKGKSVTGNVLTNDFDYYNTPLFVKINFLVPPLYGNVVVNRDGSYTYVPLQDFTGKDHFSVLICSDQASSICVKSRVDVMVLDHCIECTDPIQGITDHYSYPAGVSVQGNVLANDVFNRAFLNDVDIDLIETPSHGKIEVEDNGDFSYSPNSPLVGEDAFVYQICKNRTSDCTSVCDTTEVFLKPLFLNEECHDFLCHVQDVVITSCANKFVETSLIDKVLLYSNHSVVFTERSFVTSARGKASIKSDGRLFYTPFIDFQGRDYFEFEACFKSVEDHQMNKNEGTHKGQRPLWNFTNRHEDELNIGVEGLITSIGVKSIDISGVAQEDVELSIVSPNNTEVVLFLGQCNSGILENISFSDSGLEWNDCPFAQGLTYKPVQSMSAFNGENIQGTWKLIAKPLGSVPSPNTAFLGDWEIDFKIRPLSTKGCQKATMYIDVSGNNESLVMPDSAIVVQGDCMEIDVLSNDVDDIGFDTSSIMLLLDPKHGSASVDNDRIRYCADPFFVGRDTLEYKVKDYACLCGEGSFRTARVVVDVYAPLSVTNLDAELYVDVSGIRHLNWDMEASIEPDEFQIIRKSLTGMDTFCIADPLSVAYSDDEDITGELYYVVEAHSKGNVLTRSKQLFADPSTGETTIFYHPAAELIIWRIEELSHKNPVRIIDQLGRVVHLTNSRSGQVNVSKWSSGMYILSYYERGRPRYKKLVLY